MVTAIFNTHCQVHAIVYPSVCHTSLIHA